MQTRCKLPFKAMSIASPFNLLGLAGLFLFSVGCKKEPAPPAAPDYFPQNTGLTRVYDVRDTTYDLQGAIVKTYKKKEVVGEFTKDAIGRDEQMLEVSLTDTSKNDVFKFFERWRQYKDKLYAERTEGNTRYVVLQTPPYMGARWDGNRFNDKGKTEYRYLSTDTTVTLNGKTYEHCLAVLQRQIEGSILFDVLTYEIYAPGIGKIARYDRYKEYNFISGSNIRTLQTTSYVYEETLVKTE